MASTIRPPLAALALIALGCGGSRGAPEAVVVNPRAATAIEEDRWSDSEVVSEQGDLAVMPAPPALAPALGLADKGDHLHAAIALHEAASSAGAGSATAQMAWFFLGKSLAHLGHELAALAVFDRITNDRASPYRTRSLPWVGRISLALPDIDWPAEIAARQGPQAIREIASSQPGAILAQIHYLLGRDSYTREAFTDAEERLGRVSPKARSYLKARFFEGMSLLRRRKLGAAERSFQGILDVTDHGEFPRVPGEEVRTIRDLSWLAVARLEYEIAKDDAEIPLRKAIAAYNRVSPYSDQKDEVRLELSWTRLRLGDDHAALADFEALTEGFRRDRAEAHVVKGAAHLYQCEIDLAKEAIVTAKGIAEEELKALDPLIHGASDDMLFTLADRAHEGTLEPAMAGSSILAAAVRDREIGRLFDLIAMIDAEEASITGAEGLGGSKLGQMLVEDLKIQRDRVKRRIGAAVRTRIEGTIKECRHDSEYVEQLERDLGVIESGTVVCAPRRRRGKGP